MRHLDRTYPHSFQLLHQSQLQPHRLSAAQKAATSWWGGSRRGGDIGQENSQALFSNTFCNLAKPPEPLHKKYLSSLALRREIAEQEHDIYNIEQCKGGNHSPSLPAQWHQTRKWQFQSRPEKLHITLCQAMKVVATEGSECQMLSRIQKATGQDQEKNVPTTIDIVSGLSSCWAANCYKPLPWSLNSSTDIHFSHCWRPAFHSRTLLWLRTTTVGSPRKREHWSKGFQTSLRAATDVQTHQGELAELSNCQTHGWPLGWGSMEK